MRKLAWLAILGTPALCGCVTLGSLNDEALTAGGPIAVSTERDPCPRPTSSESFLPLSPSGAGPATGLAPSVIGAVPTSGSDLDMGRAIIAAIGRSAASAREAAPGAATDFFGMDLAQFADSLPLLDDQGVAAANAALASPVADTMARTMAVGAATSADESDVQTIRRQDMRQFLDQVGRATGANGWTASLAQSLGAFHRSGGFQALAAGSSSPSQRAALEDIVKKYLLAAYFWAYFREGAILRLEVLDDALKQHIAERIRARIPDAATREALGGDVNAILDAIRAQICTGAADKPCFAFGVIGEHTFVTRAGLSHAFPGITGQFRPLGEHAFSLDTPEWNPVIGDLVRVFVEAVGDSAFAVPGVPNSTACVNLQRLCGLPEDAAHIGRVNEAGKRTEAAARSITSVAIRGGWLFSLNNEALATSIETFISVSARKIAERAAWSREHVCRGAQVTSPHRQIAFRLQ